MTRWHVRVLAALGAVAAALLVFVVETELLDLELVVEGRGVSARPRAVIAAEVLFLAGGSSLVALLAAWVVDRLPRGRAIFVAAGFVVLILSATLLIRAVDATSMIGLGLLHLVVASLVLPIMARTIR